MSPRLEQQGDDSDEQSVEVLYGAPQHETSDEASEQELYGDPQHDTTGDDFPTELDPDLGHILDWLDYTTTELFDARRTRSVQRLCQRVRERR